MATEQDFEGFLRDFGRVRWMEFRQALFDRFPNSEDRERMFQWSADRNEKAMRSSSTPAPISRDAFVARVDSMNFLAQNDYTELVDWMLRTVKPWIPLGRDPSKEYGFRLIPAAYGLRPHRFPSEHPCHGTQEFLPDSFLGINTTVQPSEPSRPANRRKENLSEMSTRTAESDDETPGFEFHQLGYLQYCCLDNDDDDDDYDENGPLVNPAFKWYSTEYIVVARLGRTGRIEGVYIVYNMFQEKEGDRVLVKDESWGMMPFYSSEDRMTSAKIGNKLGDFRGFEKVLEWQDKIEHPVELVPLVKRPDGSAMRCTVE